MERDTGNAILIAVSLFVGAIVLGVWASLGASSSEYTRYLQNEVNAVEVVKEYRKWLAYDNTTLMPQDVMSLIFETRGLPEVWVDTDPNPAVANFSLKWTEASAPTPYTAEAISNILPPDIPYTSSLVKDVNGALLRIEMKR